MADDAQKLLLIGAAAVGAYLLLARPAAPGGPPTGQAQLSILGMADAMPYLAMGSHLLPKTSSDTVTVTARLDYSGPPDSGAGILLSFLSPTNQEHVAAIQNLNIPGQAVGDLVSGSYNITIVGVIGTTWNNAAYAVDNGHWGIKVQLRTQASNNLAMASHADAFVVSAPAAGLTILSIAEEAPLW